MADNLIDYLPYKIFRTNFLLSYSHSIVPVGFGVRS